MSETQRSPVAERQAEYRLGVARRLDEIQAEIRRLHEAVAALAERQPEQREHRRC